MLEFSIFGYFAASTLYVILSILLLTSWRGRLQGALLVCATLVSVLWAAGNGYSLGIDLLYRYQLFAIEAVKNIFLCLFLLRLLDTTDSRTDSQADSPPGLQAPLKANSNIGFGEPSSARNNTFQRLKPTVVTLGAAIILFSLYPSLGSFIAPLTKSDPRVLMMMAFNIIGLLLIEQLYRNTRPEQRWAIRYLCVGLGTLFVYDFMMYAKAALFGTLDEQLWNARGMINTAVIPMLTISIARNPKWSGDLFVSRKVIFHSTALVGTGVYLLLMATTGYYIREFGGSWGEIGQIAFITASILLLIVLLSSGQIRAAVKVFFNKHFFSYKYEYREEWIKLNRYLTSMDSQANEPITERCIHALADIVGSQSGHLWLIDENNDAQYQSSWPRPFENESIPTPRDHSLVNFLGHTQWVVEASEYFETPEMYTGLNLDNWQVSLPKLWLVVPLLHQEKLYGFITLNKPTVPRSINWEDHDLLKTVGIQLANHLVLLNTSEQLASAQQFEAYNRLSAFVVHDLKNLVAQLSMVVTNAEKHKTNPEFIDDAMDTLSHAVDKMSRLLSQLKKGDIERKPNRSVFLATIFDELCTQQKGMQPLLTCEIDNPKLAIRTDHDKLTAILGHLIQNAQEATEDEGTVKIVAYDKGTQIHIEVSDTGTGMSSSFIRNRLFKPFDTTKGNAGMGIGVFEAQQYVESHGGTIDVTSEVGKGTQFTLLLPAHPNTDIH
ncbi:MAG: PEP-CTERM system histidine kinase PrsK [Pseudomonadales bacterium]|nr:PEP-CTERM system histidine kinase PrsK [Pseudomonadales bacterium]